eukprot:11823665-Ditylum_brightwellii.AAC.2
MDLFSGTGLIFSYDLDECAIKNSTDNLFAKQTDEIERALQDALSLESAGIPFDLDPVTDPIMEAATNTLSHFKNAMQESLGLGCFDGSRRRLQSSGSLADKIRNATNSINSALATFGIVITASVNPTFDSKLFIAGVDVALSVSIKKSAADVLHLVESFFANSTDSAGANAGQLQTLGVTSSTDGSSPNFSIDTGSLANDTVISIGVNIDFGIGLDLNEIKGVASGTPFDDAIKNGVILSVNKWDACEYKWNIQINVFIDF